MSSAFVRVNGSCHTSNSFDPRANLEISRAYLASRHRAKATEHLRRAVQVWSNAGAAHKPGAEARAEQKKLEG